MDEALAQLKQELHAAASNVRAQALQRFFPEPVEALGVPNGEVRLIARRVLAAHCALSGPDWLEVAEHVVHTHGCHENVILASSVAALVVRTIGPKEQFLKRAKRWLEQDVSNWAQCDDLCINPLYLYLKARPQRLAEIFDWGRSASPWCRRASNVALVKFVGRSEACDLAQVLANCERLLADPDPYVQKGIGWMLKVAGQYQPERVRAFLQQHAPLMERATLRYAMEKLAPDTRRLLLRG